MKHNYPKSRMPNKNSTTQMLLQKYTEEELYNLWVKFNGMFKTSEYLSQEMGFWVSPYVVRYLSYKFNWVRVIKNKDLPIYKGIISGRVNPEYYKHIKFQ
jgi:hypothetical protein